MDVSITSSPDINVTVTPAGVIAVTLSIGTPGADGEGVVAGGTTGQVLAKASNDDYDTEWISVSGTGTVTSVALTVPNIFSVSGSPITESGTLVVTVANQQPNHFWAGPASGGAGAPSFRAAVAADIPDLSSVYAVAAHTHTGVYSPVGHTHSQSDITNLTSDLAGKAAASHTHAIADVTSLQTALDGKQASNPAMTDNAIVRADGTAGAVQGSLIIVNDTGDITGVASITVNGIVSSRSQYWLDNANDHRLVVDVDENLSAHRNLNVRVNDANRTLTIAGDATISGTTSGTNTGDQTIVHPIQAEFDGGGSALADDDASKVLRSHFAGTMTSWILVTEGNTGDVEIDIWKAGAGDTPVLLDSICGTAYPLGDGQATGTVTGFTDTTLAIGDTLIFVLRSASGATFVRFTLLVEE